MAKQRFQPNPNKTTAPLVPDETEEARKVRLKRTVDAIQKILTENRAIIVVNNLRLMDGRIMPEIQIQILK